MKINVKATRPGLESCPGFVGLGGVGWDGGEGHTDIA